MNRTNGNNVISRQIKLEDLHNLTNKMLEGQFLIKSLDAGSSILDQKFGFLVHNPLSFCKTSKGN